MGKAPFREEESFLFHRRLRPLITVYMYFIDLGRLGQLIEYPVLQSPEYYGEGYDARGCFQGAA